MTIMRSWLTSAYRLAALAAALGLVSPALAIEFQLPVDCELGKTCFVQNYVDIDPGLDAKDYTCGSATYDGHTGTDIRVLSMEAAEPGVPVRAAAPGVVLRVRDGVADRLIATAADKEAVKSIECGNAVIIDHGDGWETGYCHMKRGSLKVKPGDRVTPDTVIGAIGGSGSAEFAHLHFDVRYKGLPVDPFIGSVVKGECSASATAATAESLWTRDVLAKIGEPRTTVLQTGFAGGEVTPRQLELGPSQVAPLTANSGGLVFFVRAMHIRKGDVIRLVVYGPDGEFVRSVSEPIERDKATYVAFAGKKRTGSRPWQGTYEGIAEIVRDGQSIVTARGSIQPEG